MIFLTILPYFKIKLAVINLLNKKYVFLCLFSYFNKVNLFKELKPQLDKHICYANIVSHQHTHVYNAFYHDNIRGRKKITILKY